MPNIPRIIHQTWKSEQVPRSWQPLQDTWKRLHPDWEHRLWTDDDNARFIAEHYPAFLPIYKAYDQEIKRVDAVRYFIMHHYGGVYVDLDFEALRPIDGLLAGKEVVLGWEPKSHVDADRAVRTRGFTSILGNAFLASTAGHPFWEAVADALVDWQSHPSVLDATGPFLLTRTYLHYSERSRLSVMDPALLYPVSKWDAWRGALERGNLEVCHGNKAYAVHHWHGSYRREALINLVRQRLGRTA
jgi:mannosyltransferase OCH1-like enzyme